MASLAGTWIGLVAGLGGMRECGPTLKFAPQLPEGIARLSVNVEFRGRRLHVEATPSTTSYVLKQGDDLEILHFANTVTVSASQVSVFPVISDDALETILSPPRQPYGREPARRLAAWARHEEKP
jgi:alpha,alpha-trehalose phosphorylase